MSRKNKQADESPPVILSTVPPNFISQPKRSKQGLIISTVILALSTIMFFTFFLNQTVKFKSECRKMVYESLVSAITMIDECKENIDYDFETKYRELAAELNTASRVIAIYEKEQSPHQVILTDLYSATIKLPNQVTLYFDDIKECLLKITSDDPSDIDYDDKSEIIKQGYDDLASVISKFDLLDY